MRPLICDTTDILAMGTESSRLKHKAALLHLTTADLSDQMCDRPELGPPEDD